MSKKSHNSLNKSQTAISSPKNTLLNYFTKSPANPVKKEKSKACVESNAEVGEVVEVAEVQMKDEKKSLRKRTDGPSAKRKLDVSSDDEAVENVKKNAVDNDNNGDNDGNHGNGDGDGDGDGDDDELSGRRRCSKKRRIIIDDSSEEDGTDFEPDEDEYKPVESEDNDTDEYEEIGVIKEEDVDETKVNIKSGKLLKAKKNNSKDIKTVDESLKTSGVDFKSKLKIIQANTVKTEKNAYCGNMDDVPSTSSAKVDEPVQWPHQKLEFLQPNRLKDRYGRRPTDIAYDPSTLQIPESFLNTLSPGVRQWWILKSHYFDCVLFFKVGKFYELYHMDADIGVRELGFTYMRGEFAHSGFPEVSFGKMCSMLVEKGYKVARVEQTETPDMMTERCKATKGKKSDRVVRREICQIISRGTQVYGSQCQITAAYQTNYMLAIVEHEKPSKFCTYGICFLDTSIGDCYLGEFDDDRNCSRLQTLISHHMPVLVIHEKLALSKQLCEVMRNVLSKAQREQWPAVGTMRCNAEKTLKTLAEDYYSDVDSSKSAWPDVLRNMQSPDDPLGLTPHSNAILALKALGLCMALMSKYEIAMKVIPMMQYHLYVPPDVAGNRLNRTLNNKQNDVKQEPQSELESTPESAPEPQLQPHPQQQHMVLDAIAIANLHILGETNSLQATLDHCCTKFGKRLLHSWLCAPSCILNVIKERQEAVADLIKRPTVLQDLRGLFAELPDFERYLAQIHHFGNKLVQQKHPDGRAILFEEKIYNKTKIKNFIAVLNGFKNLLKLPAILGDCEAPLIRQLSQIPSNGGEFPDMSQQINFFKEAFNHQTAAETGVIAPETGVDEDYDAVQTKLNQINEDLKNYLAQQETYFGCRLSYFGNDKKRFQIEVPEKYAHKADSSYTFESNRKGSKAVRRFSTAETKSMLKQMQQAEEERNTVLKDITRRIFEKFSQHYLAWKQCINCVAYLDVLNAFAEYGRQQSVLCIPELQDIGPVEQAFIEITDGCHPCLFIENYIPNDMKLGCNQVAPISVLTGPNMGGKSTLMRQVGLLVVMAQIGAHVPAESCRLSIMDRVFTRLGAQDDMLSGQSTFYVELCETSVILSHATPNSLVLLDELGRGTGTSDGLSIAVAVVDYLADIKCCCLFSTHYYSLIEYFYKDDRVTFGHMACMVENDEYDDPTQETVTFLYKYIEGVCPKSYGFNVAKLSGIPNDIIKRAYELSKTIEIETLKRRIKNKFAACVDMKLEGNLTPNHITKLKDLIIYYRTCLHK